MPVFWTLYWLGFLGIPLIILLAGTMESGGHQKDTSHIWVYKSSGRKSHDATIREVWERNHPGKKWADHQGNQAIGCGVVLSIALIVFLAWLAQELFSLPEGRLGLRLFWQIGAPILGGVSAGVFYGLQSLISNYKSGFLRILHIIALVLMGLGVIGALVFTFLKQPLPISHHWLWAPAGAMCIFLIIGAIGRKEKKVKAGKGGTNFEGWTMQVLTMMNSWDLENIEAVMAIATLELQQGKLDWTIRDKTFFKMTEGILMDLIQGKAMSISTDEIYRGRQGVIKAVQAFYFYMVDNFPEFDIHPKIKKAITKQR